MYIIHKSYIKYDQNECWNPLKSTEIQNQSNLYHTGKSSRNRNAFLFRRDANSNRADVVRWNLQARKKITRGSCSTASHINRGGHTLSGRGFIFGADLVAFFRFFRFSILTKPAQSLTFLPVRKIPRTIRRPCATIPGSISYNERKLYILTIRLMSLLCTVELYQSSSLFKIGRRYRCRFVTLLDIFCRPRNRTVLTMKELYSLL